MLAVLCKSKQSIPRTRSASTEQALIVDLLIRFLYPLRGKSVTVHQLLHVLHPYTSRLSRSVDRHVATTPPVFSTRFDASTMTSLCLYLEKKDVRLGGTNLLSKWGSVARPLARSSHLPHTRQTEREV
jgi:hypothetical protein